VTDSTHGGRVYSYRPRPPTSYSVCRQLAAVQWTRRLAEVSRVTGDDSGTRMAWLCRRQCIAMRASWVGQTDDGIYDVTIAGHQTSHSHTHTQCHPHGPLAYVSQSINQAIQTSIVPYLASESDASHCAQRPPTTNVSHAMTACCQFDHRLIMIIGYGNSKIGYEII